MYHKRKNRLIALLVACALLFSMMGTAAAAEVDEEALPAVAGEEDASPPAEDFAMAEGTLELDEGVGETAGEEYIAPGVWSDQDPYFTDEVPEIVTSGSTRRRAPAATRAAYPTYEEAYDIMIRLQDQYPEGLRWTNFEPYGSLGKQENYRFKGGAIKGAEYGVGCAAFCFILSDAVFETVPCRVIDAGNFDYEDLHVSDFLRIGGLL